MAADRLQRHLGAKLGLAADVEEAVAFADLAVFGKRAAGLPHEPDGRPLDRLAPRGPDEEGLHHGPRLALVLERPVPRGPLAVRWLAWRIDEVRAGAAARADVELENAGSATWRSAERSGVNLAYHWLDERGNAIVWDGIRTPFAEPVAPGARVQIPMAVRGPIPPGRYALAIDLVDEHRLWFAEAGSPPLELEVDVRPRVGRALAVRGGDPETLAAQEEALVAEHEADAIAFLAERCAVSPDWSRLVLDAHQEGYAVVAGSIDATRGILRRQPDELAPWAPGTGRVPGFAHPLLCPSVVRGVDLEWLPDVAGLPAARAPTEEPWLYDGRICVKAPQRSGRRSA